MSAWARSTSSLSLAATAARPGTRGSTRSTAAKIGGRVVLGLCALLGVTPAAEATIRIDRAEVRDGVAVVKGRGAVPGARITWDGAAVTVANRTNGGFAFRGVLPADCRGRLSDTVETVLVDVLRCTPAPVGVPAPVEATGKTGCYNPYGFPAPCAGNGWDGEIQAGVTLPSPRFVDNGDGTVEDMLTGLIWLRNASCFGSLAWPLALNAANTLAAPGCGLSDGSVAGQWRLANIKELQSLIHFGFVSPALSNAAGTAQWAPGDAFSNVCVGHSYWSSTNFANNPFIARAVSASNGDTFSSPSAQTYCVWPVRGGR